MGTVASDAALDAHFADAMADGTAVQVAHDACAILGTGLDVTRYDQILYCTCAHVLEEGNIFAFSGVVDSDRVTVSVEGARIGVFAVANHGCLFAEVDVGGQDSICIRLASIDLLGKSCQILRSADFIDALRPTIPAHAEHEESCK